MNGEDGDGERGNKEFTVITPILHSYGLKAYTIKFTIPSYIPGPSVHRFL